MVLLSSQSGDSSGSILPKEESKTGNMTFKVTTAPLVEPITSTEVKLFARIDNSNEDSLIDSFITMARESAELYLGRALIEQTITATLDFWPSVNLELFMPELISVTSIKTVDEEDVKTTYSSDNYYIRTNTWLGQIVIKNGVTPPYNSDRYYGGYEIIYLAGYGDAAADVPASIKEALKLWVTIIYENRLPISGDPPIEVRKILDLYRIVTI